jgi:glycosyltransferase involved in cell wall biosynthesis
LPNRDLGHLNLIVVSHVTKAYGPMEALSEYLSKNVDCFTVIAHPLYSYSAGSSHKVLFKGQKTFERTVRIAPMPEFIHYLSSFFMTLWFVFRSKKRYNLYIGIDNLNALSALFLKKLGFVQNVIFYAADYSENRFKSLPLNMLYNLMTRWCAKHADDVWSISSRASRKLEEQGAKKEHTFVVPNGVDSNKIPKFEQRKSGSIKRLIFVGHLTQTKGVADVLKQFPKVIKEFTAFKLSIVGTGPYENQLKELTHSLNLQNYVEFLGYLPHDDMLRLLSKFDIGLAPYTFYDDYVKFCDPVKVKEYLAGGCAVVISDIPEIASEIGRKHAGIVYSNVQGLKESILSLLQNEDLLNDYRRNALELSRSYDWTNIFDNVFSLSLVQLNE